MLSVALPKGRLGDSVYKKFAAMGYACEGMEGESRKLVFEDAERGIRYILVKPSDVAVYVEYGVADLGIVGKDVLLENEPDVFELLDLGIGKCRIAVAAPLGFSDKSGLPLRIATKYPRVASRYYATKSRDIEIITLHGSMEIAPVTGLSDVIVDIVETGTTLKENGLAVTETIAESSARLIVNKASYLFNREGIDAIRKGLEERL